MARSINNTHYEHGMRIAEIRLARAFRGTEKYVTDLCRLLKERNHSSMIITLPDGPLAVAGKEMNVPVAQLPIRGDINPFTPFQIARTLRKFKVQLANTHGSHGTCACGFGAKLAGVPSIHTVHGLDNKFAGMSASHLIAVSDQVCTHLISLGISPDRISVVNTGVDIKYFIPQDKMIARTKLEIDPDPFCFAAIAMFQKHKGLPFLLNTFREVVNSAPNARLLIAGSGPMEDSLRAQVETLKLGHFVRFMGFRKDVRPILAASDCLVLPSEREGMPLVLLEAMACGRATIATDAGGSREVVREGETGMVVQPNQIDQLSKAMLHAVQNPEWTHEAGLSARRYVENERSLEKEIDETENVYRMVLGRSVLHHVRMLPK